MMEGLYTVVALIFAYGFLGLALVAALCGVVALAAQVWLKVLRVREVHRLHWRATMVGLGGDAEQQERAYNTQTIRYLPPSGSGGGP